MSTNCMATRIVSSGNELLNHRAILKDQLGVRPGQIVADFGCGGAGYFTIAAARLVNDQGQVYAVDVLKTALSSVDGKARLQGLYNIKTVWSDLEVYGAMSIPERSVDHGLLTNALYQSKKKEDMIKEVSRLIKPGGKLLIIEWNDVPVPFGPPASDRVPAEHIRELVPQFEYREEKFFEPDQYHYGLIFTKL